MPDSFARRGQFNSVGVLIMADACSGSTKKSSREFYDSALMAVTGVPEKRNSSQVDRVPTTRINA